MPKKTAGFQPPDPTEAAAALGQALLSFLQSQAAGALAKGPPPTRPSGADAPVTASRKRPPQGRGRVREIVRVQHVERLSPNTTRLTLVDQAGDVYRWDATSGRGHALRTGDTVRIRASILRHDGKVTWLTRVFFEGDESAAEAT